MAKSRLITTNLIRLLDRIDEPVYVIGHDNSIEYANQVCLRWIRMDAEKVKSARCIYTSQKLDSPIDDRVKGLAPPPEEENIDRPSGVSDSFSACCENESGKCQWRRATAIKLSSDGKPDCTLVVCAAPLMDKPDDSCGHWTTETRQHQWCTDPGALHEALAQVRKSLDIKYKLESVIGLASTSQPLLNKIDVAVKTTASVVIIGPSGSGREHLGRSIDAQRRTDSMPPVPLHCAVADQQLIQRNIKELATERTDKQTTDIDECLLLIDVDQLSKVAQSELWGFLQIPGFSFQTIATASKSLNELSRRREFHPGLAGLLSTLEIELLPLSQRSDDIPLLAQASLEEANLTRRQQLGGFSVAAMQLLQQFNWPDNIDQLARAVAAAADVAEGSVIELEDLPTPLRQASRAMEIGQPTQVEIKLDDYLLSIESELILRAMQNAKGNKSRASKLLGISRPKLLRRLQLLTATDEPTKDSATEQLDSSAFEEAEDHE